MTCKSFYFSFMLHWWAWWLLAICPFLRRVTLSTLHLCSRVETNSNEMFVLKHYRSQSLFNCERITILLILFFYTFNSVNIMGKLKIFFFFFLILWIESGINGSVSWFNLISTFSSNSHLKSTSLFANQIKDNLRMCNHNLDELLNVNFLVSQKKKNVNFLMDLLVTITK